MPVNYNVLDLTRIQTTVNVIMNEACWNYVAQPARIDEIMEKLCDALRGLRTIASVTVTCPTDYCPQAGRCVPCDLLPNSLSSSRTKSGSVHSSATVQASSSRRTKRSSSPRRGQERLRSR